eukprot:8383273-Prorocentrum_lima.AAC.1
MVMIDAAFAISRHITQESCNALVLEVAGLLATVDDSPAASPNTTPPLETPDVVSRTTPNGSLIAEDMNS